MWIRLITLMAGPEGVVQPGTVVEMATPEAQRLIQAGAAVELDGRARVMPAPPAAESAAVSPPETPEARRAQGAPHPPPAVHKRKAG
jgi:hypothetical protein